MTMQMIISRPEDIRKAIKGESSEKTEREMRIQILKQQNQIAIALAYLHAGQPQFATMVLEGMDP